MSSNGSIKIFTGSRHPAIAAEVAEYLGLPLGAGHVARFADGEIEVRIDESVRGHDVFLVQSLSNPVNDSVMELLIMIDALKRASAGSITAVVPYYAYARQDRQVVPRSPITAKLLADLLTASGVDRVMAMDLHAGQIQGFFAVPFDHLYASRVLLEAMKDAAAGDTERCVIVSPDAGGVERARYYSRKLGIGLAIVDKRRSKPNEAKVMHIIGDVEDRRAFLVDDMIDTAGTLCGGAALLREHGATSVSAFATHGLFSGPAIERIEGSVLERVYVTNTIPATEPVRACERIEILSVGATLGEAIKRVHGFTSVSSLFT